MYRFKFINQPSSSASQKAIATVITVALVFLDQFFAIPVWLSLPIVSLTALGVRYMVLRRSQITE